MHLPQLAFASPRLLPKAEKLQGRVVVLDVAFAATIGASTSFELTTRPFLEALGDRLATMHELPPGEAVFNLTQAGADSGQRELAWRPISPRVRTKKGR